MADNVSLIHLLRLRSSCLSYSSLEAQLDSPEIEHMVNLGNWELTCRLIGLDPTKTTSKPCVQLPALKDPLN